MLIVLDTNVLVSALLNPHGKPATVLRLVLQEKISIAVDTRILSEYDEVLHRERFHFDQAKADGLLAFLEEIAIMVSAQPVSLVLDDQDDLPFIEVALSGNVDFLITGNTNHFLKRIGTTAVVLPARFIGRCLRG